ncbi:MAG: AbrB family transcriptional regulator [Alphaproteobacteria bacterium]|nr:AbrB family transcriptional regulator [Alphaproteobacteria bacterium]MBL6939555.1 AbrB family transcriptional regulator [Alphaproteobacteria bacterium]MBL7100072.1 AbrB family transcriptional regulator [Alphaproteobacteria bacterium]
MRVLKWRDDLAVKLPKELVETLGLKEGDEIDLMIARVAPAATEQERREALERLREFSWNLPADFKFDREDAHKRGD